MFFKSLKSRKHFKISAFKSISLTKCVNIRVSKRQGALTMCKEEYIKRYGEEAYLEYKKRQAELTKRWREKNRDKSRKYGLDYYYEHKKEK